MRLLFTEKKLRGQLEATGPVDKSCKSPLSVAEILTAACRIKIRELPLCYLCIFATTDIWQEACELFSVALRCQ